RLAGVGLVPLVIDDLRFGGIGVLSLEAGATGSCQQHGSKAQPFCKASHFHGITPTFTAVTMLVRDPRTITHRAGFASHDPLASMLKWKNQPMTTQRQVHGGPMDRLLQGRRAHLLMAVLTLPLVL